VGVVVALIFAIVFAGSNPKLPEVDDDYPGMKWVWDISAPRWGIEAFYVSNVEHYNYMDIDGGLNDRGYNIDNFNTDILNIFLIGGGWMILSFLALKLIDRSKHK